MEHVLTRSLPAEEHTLIARRLAGHGLRLNAGETVLASCDLPSEFSDALAGQPFAALAERATVLWRRRADGRILAGFGIAATISGPHTSPLERAIPEIQQLGTQLMNEAGHAVRPRLFGGARFTAGGSRHDSAWDAFGGWQFVVPQVLLAISGEGAAASLTIEVGAGETERELGERVDRTLESALHGEPGDSAGPNGTSHTATDGERWMAGVSRALDEMANGRYRKVVLARDVVATRNPTSPGVGEILSRLSQRYPSCFVFKHHAGSRDWLGASPELLASLDGGIVRAASLAGTRARSTDPDADVQLAYELWNDPKERSEHAFVASALYEALSPLCTEVHAPAQPEVMTLPNIHHLYTPFEGYVRDGITILDVVQSVHPTPAVGGAPRRAALEAIDRLEDMDRGWYAGPIGWLDFEGNGEFAVALRSGLLGPGEALLFAGAGIVAGSDPVRELAETELKLRPLREALDA